MLSVRSSKKTSPKIVGFSQRQLRVGESLRHSLSRLFSQNKGWDPELSTASITVTEVRMSADLRYATAYVTPLGGDNREVILEALQRATPYFQKLLAAQLTLKTSPFLRFKLDTSFDTVQKIETLLRQPKVRQDLLSLESQPE